MIGVDNIRFWSSTPGKFVNRNTGEDIFKMLKIKGIEGGPQFTGTKKEWNATLVEEIHSLFSEDKLDADARVELLCSALVGGILSESPFFEGETVLFGESRGELKIVGINESRIDVFVEGKFAGAINVLDL